MKGDILTSAADEIKRVGAGKKILFATVPLDGHVNPLTGLAVHLKSIGYDVRWYTANKYAPKFAKLDIPHYPLVKALDLSSADIDDIFPERKNHKSQVAKLNFDIINAFIQRAPEYYADIVEIHRTFRFDLMIADLAFTGIPFVIEKLHKPVIACGIIPLTETSKDLPPAGLGMTPSYSMLGKLKQAALRVFADKVLFKKSNIELRAMCEKYHLTYNNENVFDFLLRRSTVMCQSGTPGFEYYRSDICENVRFVGALLPHSVSKQSTPWFDERLNKFEKVILVTQGTVETNAEKLLVPAMEAFKNTDTLVVVTTGGSATLELRARFPHNNIIIEDFIPFSDIMPYADAYVTNGGYGGVLLGIENELPLVVAGVHEGKNEINARIGFFELGINLKTETPTSDQIKRAVNEVLTNSKYKANVLNLAKEFARYDSKTICADLVQQVVSTHDSKVSEIEDELLF